MMFSMFKRSLKYDNFSDTICPDIFSIILMKVLAFNGSPRGGCNTGNMLKSALDGCRSKGAITKLINLNEINFKGCQSCLLCKRNKETSGKCYYKDNLSPILEEVNSADALLFGSPVYYGLPASNLTSFLERALYSNDMFGETSVKKKMKTGLIFTMHCTKKFASEERKYDPVFERMREYIQKIFGHCEVVNSYNTSITPNYEKYAVYSWVDPVAKKKAIKEVLPEDLKRAYDLGRRICTD
ncbi:NADPH-dependent FMN reductase [Tritrichomonas foetus]|uniref:NADPH-dependent FMN reductase n=1 Tax=Tritrichomonas foetus TaxID=1144522 RepID=A0A1J4J8G7_9EUKA|nr:NADPH-dependent FMN reductase [Tritrichomonas foetus]|eukprot:OHS95432.1 NADPH-dependent FMN reductase [Tritrichomonas foetus]